MPDLIRCVRLRGCPRGFSRATAGGRRPGLCDVGLLLYELLTGCRPFDRGSWPDSVAAVLRDPVPPLSAPGLTGKSAGLAQRLLDRCLAKDAAGRPASMAEVLRDLAAIRAKTPAGSGDDASPTHQIGAERASIVVLPFENLSPDPDHASFADGLTEELIADLSKVKALRVISRTSAMRYRSTTKSVPEIATELKVGHVLEGSVRRAGNNLRITAQLIEAASDAHLWAENYTGTLDDVFDMQEQLSRRIVDALRVVLTPDEQHRLGAREATDPRVYEVWLRARHTFHELTMDGVQRGARLAREALETLGDHALLHAALALLDYATYDFGSFRAETLDEAERHATRALELGPNLAEAHFVAGLVRYKRGDLPGAARCLRRSLDLQFSTEAAIYMSGFLSVGAGTPAEARRLAEDAAARDPLSAFAFRQVSWVDLVDGRFDASVARLQESVARYGPLDWLYGCLLGLALACAGREPEAGAAFDQVAPIDGFAWADPSRLFALALRDDVEAARALLERSESLRAIAAADETGAMIVATALGRLGDRERTLEWVGHTVSLGFSSSRFLSEHNRYLASLRGDPRFEGLMDLARENERAFDAS